MASLRSNFILLLLVLVNAGVTACNHYTSQVHQQMYLEGNDYNVREMARMNIVYDARHQTNNLIQIARRQAEENATLRETNTRLATELLRALMPPASEQIVPSDKET